MKRFMSPRETPFVIALLSIVSTPVLAQTAPNPAMQVIEQVVVTASRRQQPINEISRTVILLDQEILEEGLSKSSNIANVLGTQVPGFGAPSHIDQLRTQTLRGRDPLYLIDGVPLAFNGGAGFLQGPLVKFDSGTIERVEVLYGPTSIYGAGAVGGVIQFFSARAPTDDAFELNLRQSFVSYTQADNRLGSDALSWRSAVRAAGTLNRFDYVASYSYDSQNAVYDGNGDIANPVYYGYTDDSSYFAKLGLQADENQRLEVIYSFVDREFDDQSFGTEITADGFAIATESETDNRFVYLGDNQPRDRKTFYSFAYTHDDVWQGQLKLQAYHREDDIREPLADLGIPPGLIFPDNYQNVKNDQSDGLRLQFNRSFAESITLLVGADYEEQTREAESFVYDIGPLDNRGRDVTIPVREGLFLYPFTLDTLGIFAQVEWELSMDLRLSAGIRHENAKYNVGTGVRLFDFEQIDRLGGSGEDDGVAYNFGATYDVLPTLTVYANYAQGYQLPSLSQVSTIVPPDQPLESDEAIEPQTVDNYEFGLRGSLNQFSYAFSVYYAESDFGQNFIYDSNTGLGQYNRAPEKTYGFETSGNWQATDTFNVGATFSWTEGEFDPLDDGDFVAQSGLDIQPWKATINGRYTISEALSLNFLLLAVGDRDDAFDDEVDVWEVEGYEVLDVGLDYSFELEAGSGKLSLQLTNVFDKAYLAPSSQSYSNNALFDDRVAGAPGRALAVNIEFTL